MDPIIDPHLGDVEDDASSPKNRSLLSLAGVVLSEISLPRLIAAWAVLLLAPSLLLGAAPLAASIWFSEFFDRVTTIRAEIGSIVFVAALLVAALIGSPRLYRLAESSFWSLNALAIQPLYVMCRETLRHVVGGRIAQWTRATAQMHAATAVLSSLLICFAATWVVVLIWPATAFVGDVRMLSEPKSLVITILANSILLVSTYLAGAALVWAAADAATDQPQDLQGFDAPPGQQQTWRIAHLSDLHVVGARFGFRIECGRSGPRGNDLVTRVFSELEEIHARAPLDAILITGDVTDAGLSSEWAEFFDIVARHPRIAALIAILPGNHDLNIVDRVNPARLELPGGRKKRLRQLRALSAMTALQGDRALVVNGAAGKFGEPLVAEAAAARSEMQAFADRGDLRRAKGLSDLWARVFPLVLPPREPDGLGLILLNSNADTHFSFTCALGMVPAEQARAVDVALSLFPDAYWVVGLHHHLVEYPEPSARLSERIGTSLINGHSFVRRLRKLADRCVVMHGHRHRDWAGECAGVRILSAPSPVMGVADGRPHAFYIHRLAAGSDRRLRLLEPEKVVVSGSPG